MMIFTYVAYIKIDYLQDFLMDMGAKRKKVETNSSIKIINCICIVSNINKMLS